MAGVKFLGITVVKSGAEKDIRTLFENSMTRLTEQRSKLLDDITEWSEALIHSIYKHANHQKYLVKQEYTAQMQTLNNSLNIFLEELHVHEKKNDDSRVNELLNQCRALKFELSALETNGLSIPFIEAPNRGHLPITDEDEQCVTGYDRQLLNDGWIDRDLRSSHVSRSTNPKQTKQEQRSVTTTTDADRSMTSSKNTFNECSVCFMVFPSNMPNSDRLAHINEHSKNNI